MFVVERAKVADDLAVGELTMKLLDGGTGDVGACDVQIVDERQSVERLQPGIGQVRTCDINS